MEKTRPAWLFKNWQKLDAPRPVTWHAWGQLSDDNGGEPCAIVEHPDGEVRTVAADRLRFADVAVPCAEEPDEVA